MRSFVILALVAVLVCAYDPVFVDELKDIVTNKQDEMELDKLDDDKTMIRSEKKKKLDEILARQPEDIKKLFSVEVEHKKFEHQSDYEKKIAKATDPAVKEYLQQAEVINNDMTISDQEAKKQIKELKTKLSSTSSPKPRKGGRTRRDSDSSEE